MSTWAKAETRSSQGSVLPFDWAARAAAFSGERLQKTMSVTPASARRLAVSSTVSPAPRRRTRQPESSSKMRPVKESAIPATDVGLDPSSVSVRTRLPHSSAA